MHEMLLVEGQATDGHWYCFECGRLVHLRMDPYQLKVIMPGDETVSHHGGRGTQLQVVCVNAD